MAELKWNINDYIKYGQGNAVSGQWVRQLENASAKFHISRLEALRLETQQCLESLFAQQNGTVTRAMTDVFENSYYKTAYEIQKGLNVGFDVGKINQGVVDKVISSPWAADGRNFSERIWGNKEKLISEIHNELTQNIMLGEDPQKAIDAIANKMNTSKYNAGRLVMTEEAYFHSAAQKEMFKELGVEQYEIVATLDNRTSPICQNMDEKVFDMKDFEPGVTAPPFHVYCRSTTVPYFDDDFGEAGERAARGADGKTYYVPADMTYEQWKEAFVDGGDKSELDIVSTGNAIRSSDSSKPTQKLTDDEQYAVNRYISSDAYVLNEKLRNNLPLTEDEEKFKIDLDSALKKLPTYSGDLSRSLQFDNINDAETFVNNFKVDEIVNFKEYISTTYGDLYNPSGQVQIYIMNSEKGRNISAFNSAEKEVLYERNSEFVTKDIQNNNGVTYILLNER